MLLSSFVTCVAFPTSAWIRMYALTTDRLPLPAAERRHRTRPGLRAGLSPERARGTLRAVPRIAFIGAGSVEFTRNVLADLLTFPDLEPLTIALHDVSPKRLETAEAMAHATAEVVGRIVDVEAHLERRPAVEGADYVVNEIQVGGYDATLK